MPDQHPLINRLKLRHLRLILELEATRNLHRTAERMNLSQPSVTKLLQEIEYALKAPLFRRTSQGAIPTPIGEMAARHARLMINDVIRLQHDVDAMRSGTVGMVRIGSVVAALPEHISPVVSRVTEAHPAIGVSLTVGTSDDLVKALVTGRLDFVLARPSSTRSEAELKSHTLAREPLCIISGPSNPLGQAGHMPLSALTDARWVLPEAHTPLRRAIEATFALAQLPSPRMAVESSSMIATLDLMQHSTLLAFVPTSIAQRFERPGLIRRLAVPLHDYLGHYSLLSLEDRPLPAAAKILYDAICSSAMPISDQTFTS